jgi:hypothetical protein
MSSPTLSIGPGPEEGAHRLTVSVNEPTALWGEVARQLAIDLEDAKRAAAWDTGARLDLVGWSSTPQEARFYLAGSVLHWLALCHAQLEVPLLAHLPLVLGQPIRAWQLERRPLQTASYRQAIGKDWPFGVEGPTVARRLQLQAPELSSTQLAGLIALLRPAVRRSHWERGVLPREEGAELDGREIVLPPPGLRAGAVLEVVQVWTQLFWVELEWIHWTP